MKTLDEVIEAYEYCINNNYRDCRGCPYGCQDGESGCTNAEEKTDALHYLKEYRSKHDEMLKMEEALGYCEMAENRPLTWQELQQMEGKPVWYEHDFWKGWIILGKAEQTANGEMIADREDKWYIVKDGSAKAYRKERL